MKREEFQIMITATVSNRLLEVNEKITDSDKGGLDHIGNLIAAIPCVIANAVIECLEKAGFIEFDD